MSDPHEPKAKSKEELSQSIREKTQAQLTAILDVVEIVGGQGAHIDTVLPQPMKGPGEARQDAKDPDWDESQVVKAREVAHMFGYGSERNVNSGLSGGVRILEGGLAWKITAEHSALADENSPASIVFAGSAYRPLKDEERGFIKDHLEMSTDNMVTEYDFAEALARRQLEDTVQEEFDLPFGYQISEGNPTVEQETGQLKRLGYTESGVNVLLLRIDREEYEEDGQQKYRFQPPTETLMRFMSDVLGAYSDHDSPIGLITSNAYASRVPDALRSGLRHGREFGVAMYGRSTLAKIQGVEMKPDTPLNQLPGELRVMHDNLHKLLAEVSEK